jgi:hypothetical protein
VILRNSLVVTEPRMNRGAMRIALIAGLLATVSGCGVARYQEATFTVRDELDEPISLARVSLQSFPNGAVGQLDSGRVPFIQSGTTDDRGNWKVTVQTDHTGVFVADCDGYERKAVRIEKDTLRDGGLVVKLKHVNHAAAGGERPGTGLTQGVGESP